MVNFQSFNSYDAALLGCTTYSFGVNLGIYIVGGPNEEWVKRDSDGRLVPTAFHGSFVTSLKKAIFSIDPEGQSLGPVFQEVRALLRDKAMPWYATPSTIEREVRRVRSLFDRLGVPQPLRVFRPVASPAPDLPKLTRKQAGGTVQVVSFVPPGKRMSGLCVGICWPELAETEPVRPKLVDCHLFLCPPSLDDDARAWLSMCEDPGALSRLLDEPDWEIFAAWPTMRGYGPRRSVPRFLLKAVLAHRQGYREKTDHYLAEARDAIAHASKGRQPNYQKWVDRVSLKLS